MIRTSTTLPLALLLSVAACGRSPVNEQARPTNEVAVNAAMEPSPASAFDAASKNMRDAMMAAVGSDAGDNWVRKMIAHHQGAIDMAVLQLRYGKNEHLKRIAQEIIVSQLQEIAAMKLAIGEQVLASAPAPTQPGPVPVSVPAAHDHMNMKK